MNSRPRKQFLKKQVVLARLVLAGRDLAEMDRLGQHRHQMHIFQIGNVHPSSGHHDHGPVRQHPAVEQPVPQMGPQDRIDVLHIVLHPQSAAGLLARDPLVLQEKPQGLPGDGRLQVHDARILHIPRGDEPGPGPPGLGLLKEGRRGLGHGAIIHQHHLDRLLLQTPEGLLEVHRLLQPPWLGNVPEALFDIFQERICIGNHKAGFHGDGSYLLMFRILKNMCSICESSKPPGPL